MQRAILRQNLLRLAYISEAFGGHPSDYWDGEVLRRYDRLCLDEAALKVLSETKSDIRKEAEAKAKAESDAKKGGVTPTHTDEVAPSLGELIATSRKAKQEAVKKAILTR